MNNEIQNAIAALEAVMESALKMENRAGADYIYSACATALTRLRWANAIGADILVTPAGDAAIFAREKELAEVGLTIRDVIP